VSTADPREGDWAAQRRRAIEVHQAAQRARRDSETARARELVTEFTRQAVERELRTVPLVATAYNGRGTYRTGLRGWYLKPDRSLAVGVDGEFYILSVPASLAARLRGARITPSDPPLQVGEGARDGESIPLPDLLTLRLDAANNWP
jgi:hypothetical protein